MFNIGCIPLVTIHWYPLCISLPLPNTFLGKWLIGPPGLIGHPHCLSFRDLSRKVCPPWTLAQRTAFFSEGTTFLAWGPVADMADASAQLRYHSSSLMDATEAAATAALRMRRPGLAASRGAAGSLSSSAEESSGSAWGLFPLLPPATLLGRLALASAQLGRRDHALLAAASRAALAEGRVLGPQRLCELAWALAISEHQCWRGEAAEQDDQAGQNTVEHGGRQPAPKTLPGYSSLGGGRWRGEGAGGQKERHSPPEGTAGAFLAAERVLDVYM